MKVDTTERPQFRKRRISQRGKVVRVTETDGLVPRGELEDQMELVLPALLDKGWCVSVRNGYVALTGLKKEEIGTNNNKKQYDLIPRDEDVVSIAKISMVDSKNKKSVECWEVKTHWTSKRNIFKDFQSAWIVFLEIEKRWDPGTILWTNIDIYEPYEPY